MTEALDLQIFEQARPTLRDTVTVVALVLRRATMRATIVSFTTEYGDGNGVEDMGHMRDSIMAAGKLRGGERLEIETHQFRIGPRSRIDLVR